jgi:hypothetical protein
LIAINAISKPTLIASHALRAARPKIARLVIDYPRQPLDSEGLVDEFLKAPLRNRSKDNKQLRETGEQRGFKQSPNFRGSHPLQLLPLKLFGVMSEREVIGYLGQMQDVLTTAEIQILRLKLLAFADQQSDQSVRFQCAALDAKLAEALEGDDLILRRTLANSVQQLEAALRRPAIEKATAQFLTGRRRNNLSA